ncbi:ATP-binding protein [Niallia sp. XMNu-256]|uniref:ATP-binding protein n=1 Tax=Niallia sp. XMNu-256 TaxID=3082444 RepID=UPI0030CAB0D7
MKYKTNRIILYILIVFLPIALLTGYFSIRIFHLDSLERQEEAKRMAEIHEDNWNQFIEQTDTIQDILSLSIISVKESVDQVDSLLQKGTRLDPRYAGMFLLDQNGRVIHGDDSLLLNTSLNSQLYIKEVLATKDTIISDQPEKFKNGQNVIGIAKPIIENDAVVFVIVSYFKPDYIKNVMQTTFPNKHFIITNSKKEMVMEINAPGNKTESETFFTLAIDRIPWEVHVSIPPANHTKLLNMIIGIGMISAIFFNLIYFLAVFMMQRRIAVREKKQNDLQKLELLGTFAASIAHEIRNPLTGIKGLIQLLNENHRSDKEKAYFSIIDQEINRINEIVNEFLILGKPSIVKTDIIDLNNIIKELIPLIEYEAKKSNHTLTTLFPEETLYIEGSKDQMKQVLLNITKNALESMTENGAVTIKLQAVVNEVYLSVTDTGHGISPKQMKKIFTPFYTSKETGTGLGLIICKRIIEARNGKIEIKSELNKGTTITIRLPIANYN